MIKYSYTIEIFCCICNKEIKKNTPTIRLNNAYIGYLSNLEEVDDGIQTDGWGTHPHIVGTPYIRFYGSDGSNPMRDVDWNEAIKLSSEIPEEVTKLRDRLRYGEAHVECYANALLELNRILNLKAFL